MSFNFKFILKITKFFTKIKVESCKYLFRMFEILL